MFSVSFSTALLSGNMEDRQSSGKPTEILYALRKLEEILHQKELQISLLELDFFSSLKNLAVLKKLKGNANSNKLEVEAVKDSEDFTGPEAAMKEEKRNNMDRVINGRKLLTDSWASSSKEAARMSTVSPSKAMVCVDSGEGRQNSQGSEIEQLKERLAFLEEETKIMRLEILEHVEEKKILVNEIFQQFQTIYYYLQHENGETAFDGSLIGMPPQEVGLETDSSPTSIVTNRDIRTDLLPFKEAPQE